MTKKTRQAKKGTRTKVLLIGWSIFLLTMILPVNVSIGGLTDPGQPHSGFINVFYSFLCIVIIISEGLKWDDRREALTIILDAGLGVFNFLMLIAPSFLLLRGKKAEVAQSVMIVAAIYVCTAGFVVYRMFPLLYGHYVWCLSFIIVALALNLRSQLD